MILEKDGLQFDLHNEPQIAAFKKAGFKELDTPIIPLEIQEEINRVKKFNQEQLVEYAKEKGIDLGGITGKANIQAKIIREITQSE